MAYAMVPQFGNQPQGKNGRVRPDVFSNFMSNLPRPSGGGISMSGPSATTGGAGEQIDDRLATPTRVTARRSNGNMTMSGPSPAVNLNPGNPTQFYQAGNKANAMRESADYLEHLPSSIQHAGGYSHLMAPGINQEQNKDAGSSMVAPDVMNWRSQHAKYLRNQADMLETPFMYQPQQTDPRVQVAGINADARLAGTESTNQSRQGIADANNQTRAGIADQTNQTRQGIAQQNNDTRAGIADQANQTRAATTQASGERADKSLAVRQATTQQASDDRNAATDQKGQAQKAISAREERRIAAHNDLNFGHVIGAVQNSAAFKNKTPEEQVAEANRIYSGMKKNQPQRTDSVQAPQGAGSTQYSVGQIITGNDGKRYKVTALSPDGDPNKHQVELVQ